jgi:hypothetical protein
LTSLDEPYRTRAAPPGSSRHLAWLFSAPAARAPLLGIFALLAEWRATLQADIAPEVAATKLAWWRDEIQRLRQARPVHPIGRYLLASVTAMPSDWAPLERAIEAAARQAGGAVQGTAADRADHADALIGGPLRVAATLGVAARDRAADPAVRALEACTRAIAAGELLAPTAAAGEPVHAGALRAAARREYVAAVDALPPVARARYRGLLVLAVLEAHHLSTDRPGTTMPARLSDLFLAWRTARRAARADPRNPEIP